MSRLKQLSQCLVEKYSLSEQEANEFVASLFEIIRERLLTDKLVKVKGLGTFKLAEMNARESVNVNTGERITIEGRYKLSFTPENDVRDKINAPFSSFESVDLEGDVDFSAIDEKYNVPSEAEHVNPVIAAAVVPVAAEVVNPVIAEATTVETPAKQQNPTETQETEKPVKEQSLGESAEEQIITEPTGDVQPSTHESMPQPEPVPSVVAAVAESVEPQVAQAEQEEPHASEPEEVKPEKQEEPVAEKAEAESPLEDTPQENEPTTEQPVVANLTEESNSEKPNAKEQVEQHKDNVAENVAVVSEPVCEELLREDTDNNKTIIKLLRWLLAIIILILLCIGAYFAYNVYRDSNSKPQPTETTPKNQQPKPQKPAVLPDTTDKAKADSLKAKQEAEALEKEKKEKEEKEAEEEQEEKDEISEIYNNKDARVRTGAYNIVGTDKIVKVKKGQTLETIAKKTLGKSMQCYIEVYNDGKSTVQPGDKIKIPKLELKKKKKHKKK